MRNKKNKISTSMHLHLRICILGVLLFSVPAQANLFSEALVEALSTPDAEPPASEPPVASSPPPASSPSPPPSPSPQPTLEPRPALQPTSAPLPPPIVAYTKVSVGVFVTCGISGPGPWEGQLFCMGNNEDGAVGDGTPDRRTRPTRVLGNGTWDDVSSGDWSVCGHKSDNTAWCWGYNGGRLGLGSDEPVQAFEPQKLKGNWDAVSAGHFHACGIQQGGQGKCWGNNRNGRLGNGEATGLGAETEEASNEYTPLAVKNGDDFVEICAKGSHSCGRKNDSSVYCWGGNESGEIDGAGVEKGSQYTSPHLVPGKYKQITCGLRYSCAVDMTDQLVCWGQMSGGPDIQYQFKGFEKVAPGLKIKKVSGGMQHVMLQLTNNTVRGFGLGWHGQLGNGLDMTADEPYAPDCLPSKPCEIKGGGLWRDIAAGEYNSCGIKNDGAMYCMGENAYGNLGSPKIGQYFYDPYRVPDPLVNYTAPAPAPTPNPAPAPAPFGGPSLAPSDTVSAASIDLLANVVPLEPRYGAESKAIPPTADGGVAESSTGIVLSAMVAGYLLTL